MTEIAGNYAKVLYELGISREAIEESAECVKTKELIDALKCPIVSKKEKHKIVDRVFPDEMHNFMKVLCDYNSVDYIYDIFEAYKAYADQVNSTANAALICVEAPGAEQMKKLEQFVKKETGKKNAKIHITYDSSLLGGFVLKIDDKEYDWSIKGRMTKLTRHLKNI